MSFELIDRYMRGDVELEVAARALAVDLTGYGFSPSRPPPYTAEEQALIARFEALAERIYAIQEAQRLNMITATLQDIQCVDGGS